MLINGTVVRGHGVASGCAGDPRFPAGTLGLQLPIFASLGLQLDGFYHGTINVSLAPLVPMLELEAPTTLSSLATSL